MSVLEDLRGIEQRITRRLEELGPLVDEYEELHRIAERLGLDLPKPGGAKRPKAAAASSGRTVTRRATRVPARKRRARTDQRKRPGGTRAAGAERRARVIELIEARPGITVADLSKEMGVDPPPLYRVVRRLQADGVVRKDGKALHLA